MSEYQEIALLMQKELNIESDIKIALQLEDELKQQQEKKDRELANQLQQSPPVQESRFQLIRSRGASTHGPARCAKTVSGRMWNPKGSWTVTLRRRTWPFIASWLCCLGREEDSITVSQAIAATSRGVLRGC